MYDPEKITFFAKADARGKNVKFGIKAKDRTRHVYVIGKTGMGKSTLLENMAVQDIQNGEGMAFIDPHGATAETLLQYIPEHRKKDVLYFAPFDTEYPVAFNVMEDVGPERRHLVASGLMSVFKKIFVDAWSARMEYILTNTIMALLEYPDSTLLGVNRMLSDKAYRKKVVDNIQDPAVKSFWVDEFANYNERYMQEAGDAIKNKIGQFTANPLIRNIIGQPKSSFDIRKIMDEKKIIIMNLSKGLVGESNANLLGSMLTTRIYLAAMSRADMSPQQMQEAPNFYFYVDEFQSFANATFADILSEARKYKLNLTIAHQYIEQMEEEVRNAVFGNVGTTIAFRVGPFDAEILETIFSPQFFAVDICNLGFAQVYLSLMIDGIGSRPFSAVTLPPIDRPEVSLRDVAIANSREQFASERAEVEKNINIWHEDGRSDGGGKKDQQRSGSSTSNKRSESGRASDRGGSADKKRSVSKRSDSSADTSRASDNNKSDTAAVSTKPVVERVQKDYTKPAPERVNSPDLASLREILRSISGKEKQIEEKNPKSNDDTRPETRRGSQQSDNNRTDKNKPQNSGGSLRDALAGALAGVVGLEKSQAEDKPAETPPTQTQQSVKLEKKETVTVTSSTANTIKEEEDKVEVQGESSRTAIDPKQIERMLRTRGSDTSPFK